MEDLHCFQNPYGPIRFILLLLDIDDIIALRLVCKAWHAICNDFLDPLISTKKNLEETIGSFVIHERGLTPANYARTLWKEYRQLRLPLEVYALIWATRVNPPLLSYFKPTSHVKKELESEDLPFVTILSFPEGNGFYDTISFKKELVSDTAFLNTTFKMPQSSSNDYHEGRIFFSVTVGLGLFYRPYEDLQVLAALTSAANSLEQCLSKTLALQLDNRFFTTKQQISVSAISKGMNQRKSNEMKTKVALHPVKNFRKNKRTRYS